MGYDFFLSVKLPICEPTWLTVVIIIYGKSKKLLAESQTMSLSLRRFVALPKNCAILHSWVMGVYESLEGMGFGVKQVVNNS